jgi:hypothetical protein
MAQDRVTAPRVIFVVAAFSLVVISCGGGGATAARYSSAQHVIAALDHGGLRCTGGSYSNSPVVSGATSEATCNFSSSEAPLIDVFPRTVTTAVVLHDSVSTGTQKIWSDVGPNWWVQTSSAYVKRVQMILGGRIIGGPWHPASRGHRASSAPSSNPALTADRAMCKTFNANIGNGGESQIAQALVAAGTSVTPKLSQDITKAITSASLHADLQAQVKVTLDCALVQNGVTP